MTAICVSKTCGLIPPESSLFYARLDDAKRIVWESFECSKTKCSLDLTDMRFLDEDISLACTGDLLHHIAETCSRKYLHEFLSKCSIYARMSPQQKQLLVEMFQEMGTCVGFCGDGANDIGALKAADVGISLSQAEASVAAPFTSRSNHIECVLHVLKEGRASLVTSFCSFKFMSLYSMVQFTSLSLLYTFGSSLSDGQFVYIDLMQILPLGVLMCRFEAAPVLSTKRPTAKLISATVLTSIIGQLILQAVFQMTVFWWSFDRTTKTPPTIIDEANVENIQNTMVALLSYFIYPTMALVYCAGKPYRDPNYAPFYFYWLGLFIFNLVVLFSCPSFLFSWFELVPTSLRQKSLIFGLAMAHLIVSFTLERWCFPKIAKAIQMVKSNKA